jgi:hypothetical protein
MSQTRLHAYRRAVPRRARTWFGGALCAAGGTLLTLGTAAGDPGMVAPVFAGGPPHTGAAPAARRAPAATQAAQRAAATQSVTTQAAPAPQTVTTQQIQVPETVTTQQLGVVPREHHEHTGGSHAGGSHAVHREHHSRPSMETSSLSAVVSFSPTPAPAATTSSVVAATSAPVRHRAAVSIPQTGTGTAPLTGLVLVALGVLVISTSGRRRQPVGGLSLEDDELPWYW